MCVVPNIPWIANLHINESQYGCTTMGCVACTLCAHVGSSCTLEPVIHARAESVKVCPSCPAQCLSFSRQPTSGSWAHKGRVLQNAVYDWYSHFRSGQELLEDKPHIERPSTGNSSRGEGVDACRTTGEASVRLQMKWFSCMDQHKQFWQKNYRWDSCVPWLLMTVKGIAERQLQVNCLRSQLRMLAS